MNKNQLNTLLDSIYKEINNDSPNQIKIKDKLIDLLSFLCSLEGRTNENCRYVNNYFCLKDNWFECIERLPKQLHDVLFDIGGSLHDAVKNPEIAANFESTPEQLLTRIKKLKI
ncbi:MAG: hypothetical protein GY845_29070 [Planctomycetes bacterium]|nr:hypothetical protein [Planctomycetota bacterium]